MKRTLLILAAFAAALRAQIPDFTPKTPLIGALLHNDIGEAKRLLRDGADPNQGTFAGLSPLILAISRQDVELVRTMAAKGAKLDAPDRTGSTPIMWAAFNEAGAPAIVEELLKLGADPFAANKAGETALSWALKRGETPVVAALRKAGLVQTAEIRKSLGKAIALLQSSGAKFSEISRCYSCHHQALPHMAMAVARRRGIPVDETAIRRDIASAIQALRTVSQEAVHNRDRIPDPPIGLSYTLLGLAAMNYPPDDVTNAMAGVVAAWQAADGAFYPLPAIRPPLEASEFSATALSVRALHNFDSNPPEKIARARQWLISARPRTTEDHAMRLLGLVWSGAPPDIIRSAAAAVVSQQRADGGWAQLPGLDTDAYATGQSLYALHEAGLATTTAAYRRGVSFLLRTQFADGSWLVRSRTYPVQPPNDSGFPHGKHQWISAAGTSWAVMALSLLLPPGTAAGSM